MSTEFNLTRAKQIFNKKEVERTAKENQFMCKFFKCTTPTVPAGGKRKTYRKRKRKSHKKKKRKTRKKTRRGGRKRRKQRKR